VVNFIITLIAAIIGGILYRKGGTSDGTLWRDLGVPCVGVALLVILNHLDSFSFATFIGLFTSMGLMYAAQTTYFKRKNTDATALNWVLVGLANGIALIPYAIAEGCWFQVALRTFILAILITLWSEYQDEASYEEFGRGFLIISTLSIL